MRNTTYFSQLKQSLFDFMKQSTQPSDLKSQKDNQKTIFYHHFHKTKKIKQCKIVSIEIIHTGRFQRSYALYTIEILTSDLIYSIKKRFSEFYLFYQKNQIQNFLDVKCPSKTYFQTGCAQNVTKQRAIQLNNLIQKILIFQYQDILYEFYDFIEIFEHYQEEGLLDNDEQESYPNQSPISDEEIINKISKLNHQPANSLIIIQQIRGALFQRKKRIPYDVIKHFLFGSGEEEGIISIIKHSSNEIILLKSLQILVQILSPETNRDNQPFLKVFSRCNPFELVLNQYNPVSDESIIKITYFELLRIYKQIRGEQVLKDVIKNYQNGKQLQQQFNKWSKWQFLEGRG